MITAWHAIQAHSPSNFPQSCLIGCFEATMSLRLGTQHAPGRIYKGQNIATEKVSGVTYRLLGAANQQTDRKSPELILSRFFDN